MGMCYISRTSQTLDPCAHNPSLALRRCRCDDCHNKPEGGLLLPISVPHGYVALGGGGHEESTTPMHEVNVCYCLSCNSTFADLGHNVN